MVVRAVQVALVVGTARKVVNQGREVVGGSMSLSLGLRIAFT